MNLSPVDEAKLESLLRDPDGGLREICSNGPAVKAFLLPALQQSLDFHRRVGSAPPWQSYLAIESQENQLVGGCGFKGNPNEAGEVEIGYGTVPGLEGRGYATRMAEVLVKIAFRSCSVRRVIAHTLPESNASIRVLRKIGMQQVAEVMDPDDGKVWRWEITRPKS